TGCATSEHSLLLRADGTVWATGWNLYGQLGDGTNTNRAAPVQVRGPNGAGFLSNIIAIAAGNIHNIGPSVDGTLYTWGSNSNGQLGVSKTAAYSRFPAKVVYPERFFAIAAGALHSLALSARGRVNVCGWGQFGQLGLGYHGDQYFFQSPPE